MVSDYYAHTATHPPSNSAHPPPPIGPWPGIGEIDRMLGWYLVAEDEEKMREEISRAKRVNILKIIFNCFG